MKTFFFFGLHLNLVENLHERPLAVRGAIWCLIFQKGAIVQKRLKAPEFYIYRQPIVSKVMTNIAEGPENFSPDFLADFQA